MNKSTNLSLNGISHPSRIFRTYGAGPPEQKQSSLRDREAKAEKRSKFIDVQYQFVKKVVDIFKERHLSLKIAGLRNGYWQSEQEGSVTEEIKKAKPKILFVAISSPKKEQFLGKYLKDMDVPFAMGVGGSFNVLAGLTKRAPLWMQKSGFEWFYRFLQEPKRMFKRYFVDDMYFFWLLAKEMLRR